jgi:hypothetical protein
VVKPTHDEIIRGLTRDVEVLKTRLDGMRGEIGGLPDLTIKVALLQQRVEGIHEGWKIWMARLWMIVGPLLGATVGALLTYYLNKK